MPLVVFVLLMLCLLDDIYQFVLPHIPFLTEDGWLDTKLVAIAAIYWIGSKCKHK